jgi:hypothetical protein
VDPVFGTDCTECHPRVDPRLGEQPLGQLVKSVIIDAPIEQWLDSRRRAREVRARRSEIAEHNTYLWMRRHPIIARLIGYETPGHEPDS